MAIAHLPPAPDPRDPLTFDDLAGPWSLDLDRWTDDLNVLNLAIGVMRDAAAISTGLANDAAVAAAQSKADAAQALAAAQAISGATLWAAGAYATGSVVWSPANGQNYRRRAPGGASATDPSADAAGWFPLLLMQALPMVRISVNTTGVPNVHYLMDPPTAAGVPYTLKFPAAPNVGDLMGMSHFSGLRTCVLDGNGNKVFGQATTVQIDALYASQVFKFSGATYGWIKQ